jgi:cytochrome c-type biogenesis protein CcmE
MKAKHQRLTLLVLAIAAVLGAVLLAMSALRDQASYFYAPADVARKGLPLNKAVRIGGMVKEIRSEWPATE